ncbi:hypothetical protein [Chryseobacterium taichungense]|uniref:hypothetical protein n=1 Tax=Chryseobacterium taichungense TaxID=295069 RepID=UPI0028AD5D5B|nr:hypothetical protein [Chryseobacterium taichungense]
MKKHRKNGLSRKVETFLCFFILTASLHLNAQSFSGDEAGIYIEKGTSVYVKDGVTVSGLEHDGYITENSFKTVPENKNLLSDKKKSNRKYAELKKPAKAQDVRKPQDPATSKIFTLPLSENRYRLGLTGSNGSLAIITGNPSVKYAAVYAGFSFEKYIIFREEERVSYATTPSPVSGILTIHFSRPPPFNGIV